MKKLFVLIATVLFAFHVTAQDITPGSDVDVKYKYCVVLKDGKIKVMEEGKELVTDVILANGTKITLDAIVIRKDGSKQSLQNGECVDKDGRIIPPKDNEKMKIRE